MYMYTQFGRVTLIEKAPASGTMIELITDKPGVVRASGCEFNRCSPRQDTGPRVVDVQTRFATTGGQPGETGLEYSSTYAFIPPGKETADFNLLVAVAAHIGEVAKISAVCVGASSSINKCQLLNVPSRVLTVTVAP